MDLAEAARRVDHNVLGRLMHGQRELFHSNLLAWFFDVMPDAADAVFRPLSIPGKPLWTPGKGELPRRAQRERENLDLVLHWPDRAPLVIENKVFSLPSDTQLDEYKEKTTLWNVRPSLCLLSMSPPRTHLMGGEHFTRGGWRYLSYTELADRIEAALPRASTWEAETMRRYAALVRDLATLIGTTDIQSDTEHVWLDIDAKVVMSGQMRAALQKARSQRVALRLAEIVGSGQAVEFGISRSLPLVSWFERVHADGEDVHLGWQLQGDQFRRAVIFTRADLVGTGTELRKRRETVAKEHSGWFDMPPALNDGAPSRTTLNHFAPDFVYQYVSVPDLTIAALADAAAWVHARLGRYASAGDPLPVKNFVSALPDGIGA